jgi:hypothetical protein
MAAGINMRCPKCGVEAAPGNAVLRRLRCAIKKIDRIEIAAVRRYRDRDRLWSSGKLGAYDSRSCLASHHSLSCDVCNRRHAACCKRRNRANRYSKHRQCLPD